MQKLNSWNKDKAPVKLFMFSHFLRSHMALEEVNTTGARSYISGRNLADAPFKQFSKDGQIKREYLNHRSSLGNEIVSYEIKLENHGNL
jgi:hypothetical protein